MKQRRCPKIQLCPTCGELRTFHPGNRLFDCPVPVAVIDALRRWKATHGKRWKAALREAWLQEEDLGCELQQARNMIGPRRLDKIKL